MPSSHLHIHIKDNNDSEIPTKTGKKRLNEEDADGHELDAMAMAKKGYQDILGRHHGVPRLALNLTAIRPDKDGH